MLAEDKIIDYMRRNYNTPACSFTLEGVNNTYYADTYKLVSTDTDYAWNVYTVDAPKDLKLNCLKSRLPFFCIVYDKHCDARQLQIAYRTDYTVNCKELYTSLYYHKLACNLSNYVLAMRYCETLHNLLVKLYDVGLFLFVDKKFIACKANKAICAPIDISYTSDTFEQNICDNRTSVYLCKLDGYYELVSFTVDGKYTERFCVNVEFKDCNPMIKGLLDKACTTVRDASTFVYDEYQQKCNDDRED